MKTSILLNTDSYKASHFLAYPYGTQYVSSYIESRGGLYDQTVFFGLQMFIKEYLLTAITQSDINYAEEFFKNHGEPFNRSGWEYILNTNKGHLPVVIKAVPEGTIVPIKNALLVIENTDPNCAWLVNYLETSLLRSIWYPTTISTQTYFMKKKFYEFLNKTSDSLTSLPFALLDFSARGCTSLEANKISGAAYLTNFMGSDSVAAVDYVNKMYYSSMSGYSVPATEHSIQCSYGEENEKESFVKILRQMSSQGHKTISVVSDTWNIYKACDYWVSLKSLIKELSISLVVRPDSGDPLDVLPKIFEILGAGFGYTINSKGFKVLNDVKVLWGDGIDPDSFINILQCIVDIGYSTENILLGSGGGLAQKVNRDTCKFALKASAVCINGEWKSIAKKPITDQGKTSKKGRLDLILDNGEYKTVTVNDVHDNSIMRVVYRDGLLLIDESFETIKNRIV